MTFRKITFSLYVFLFLPWDKILHKLRQVTIQIEEKMDSFKSYQL